MDMEDPVFEFIDGFDIVHLLPDVVAGVKIDAEVGRGNDFKQLSEDCRRTHQVLPARPLVSAEQHRAVLNGDFDVVLFSQSDDRRPDLFKEFNVFFHRLCLIAADKRRYHTDTQLGGGFDQGFQMGDGSFPLGKVRIHGVGIESERGDVHSFAFNIVLYIVGIDIIFQHAFRINVGNTSITPFRFARRPACDLQAFKAHFSSGVNGFLKIPAIQDCGE